MALKGQYVVNKHTHKQSEAELVVDKKSQSSYTCITHSVRVLPCEESTGLIDESQAIRTSTL